MRFLKRLFGSKHEVPALLRLRKGMWVVLKKQVGILNDYRPSGEAEFHVVAPETGETVEVVTCALGELRQAALAEIPRNRRPSVEYAKLFGYV